MKITPESMKEVYDNLWMTFCEKNHDYGNSFEQSLDKHGLIAGVVRMEDKMNRISTLTQGDKDAQIASESLVDTLMDLSNYAAMSACWLMHKDDVYNEDDIYEGLSGSVVTTMGREEFEKTFHFLRPSFEGHQEKVNERPYYDKDDVSDEEIIKNWGLVGEPSNETHTIRSRTTGQYFTEDDNPELFKKIYGVLRAHYGYESFKKMKDQLTGEDEVFEGQFNDIKELVVEQINRSRDVATTDGVKEVESTELKGDENNGLVTEIKGLENGYFIRQHIHSDNSYRYTIAFNPGGTIKTQDGEEKPYVIECFGNDYDGMNVWAIHVFDTLEDMVYALDYDLRVRKSLKSKNFRDSIKGLDVKSSVYTDSDAPKILGIWEDTFGEAFNNQMLSKDLNTEESIEKYHGIKTFGPVFISEQTAALIIKGTIRDDSVKRPCDFIWFSDTKEVLLEVDNTIPEFNRDGVIYGAIYEDNEYVDINPLYEDMDMKIMSRFDSCSVSELKNLVFFNDTSMRYVFWGETMKITPESKIFREEKTGRENIEADMESDTEVICRAVKKNLDKPKPLLTDPKGLENGYFIRQHTNTEDSFRYTLAFNPEGTVKTQLDEDLPYVIECYGNNYDGMTRWAIHVFNTREDMVAALNHDLKVRDDYKSRNFGDSICGLGITKYVLYPEDTAPVYAAWFDAFGEPVIKNMTSRNIFIDGYFDDKQGIKTFGIVFISEKTGALVVKGLIRERYSDINHHFLWFSDTKEVLLELMNAAPKFNNHGIFYDIDSTRLKTGENIYFNPLYNNMEDKILSKFHSWDGSELKNLAFFNEDEELKSEFTEKTMQIPGDLSEKKSGNTDSDACLVED